MASPTREKKTLGIAETARAIGCSESALRRLDRIGVARSDRDPWNRRLFSHADVDAARRYLATKLAAKRAATDAA